MSPISTFEIDGVEYGPPPTGDRATVDQFMIGDRIGSNHYLITASGPGSYPELWALTWIQTDGSSFEYEGPCTQSDFRWVQTMYIIKEAEEL